MQINDNPFHMVRYCWLYRCLHGCVLYVPLIRNLYHSIMSFIHLSIFYSNFWTSNCKQELFLDKVAAAGNANGRLTSNYSLPLTIFPYSHAECYQS